MTNYVKIAPSILSSNFYKLGEEITTLDKSECDYIHIDVMDGHFVPNLTLGPGVVKSIRPYTKKIFDVHLMINPVMNILPSFIKAGSDIITIHHEISDNVFDCIDLIKKQAENVSNIYSVYVTDNKGKLLGKVSLKDILLAKDNSRIKDIYDDFVISVDAKMNQEEVSQIMQKYDLTVLPVVNKRGKLLGRITIDDVVDVITETAEEERQIMSGITSDVEEDDSIWKLSNARLPWLVIGIVGGLFGAFFLGSFESNYINNNKVFLSLSFFIPLIMATAGNVGIQSSSIVIQSLSNPSAFENTVSERLFKVLLVSILNGIVLSLIVYFGLLVSDYYNILDFGIYSQTALIVSVSLFSIVMVSSLLGTITPIILDRLNFNPALASGPFITTTNDLIALAIYFIVALSLGGF